MAKDRFCGKSSLEQLEMFGQNIASLKMSKCSLEEDLTRFSATLPPSGTMRLIRHSMHSTAEQPNEGVGFTFWGSVMESPPIAIYSSLALVVLEPVNKAWNLSKKALNGILKRACGSMKPLPTLLAKEVTNLMNAESHQH